MKTDRGVTSQYTGARGDPPTERRRAVRRAVDPPCGAAAARSSCKQLADGDDCSCHGQSSRRDPVGASHTERGDTVGVLTCRRCVWPLVAASRPIGSVLRGARGGSEWVHELRSSHESEDGTMLGQLRGPSPRERHGGVWTNGDARMDGVRRRVEGEGTDRQSGRERVSPGTGPRWLLMPPWWRVRERASIPPADFISPTLHARGATRRVLTRGSVGSNARTCRSRRVQTPACAREKKIGKERRKEPEGDTPEERRMAGGALAD